MSQYALFMWDQYYPCGGLGDYVGTFTTREEAEQTAQRKAEGYCFGTAQIVLVPEMQEVSRKRTDDL